MRVQVNKSIDDISADEWNTLAGDNPFLRHEFLAALEHSGSADAKSGWAPLHLAYRDNQGQLAGALPLYLKSHSYGEFVFDWAWADAYQRNGLAYYPKLVSAVPYSPVPGLRLLIAAGATREDVAPALIAGAHVAAKELRCSSIHCLFPLEAELPEWNQGEFLTRTDTQFHWHNRDYRDFEHFLESFTADRRKKVRRERRRIAEAGIEMRMLAGDELDAGLMEALYRFYVSTYEKRGRTAYLTAAFFQEIRRTMPQALRVCFAFLHGEPVAAAICLQGGDTLYGRHWGSVQEFHSLHFEACYYQGIEYCIRAGLKHFNPGTQGEHKISRGFEPTYTWSAHWLADPRFRAAIDEYLQREQHQVAAYLHETETHLPFHADREGADD
ncbi:MAG TPA: GNAT family N-acetyltransferase [Gammaproteobacteria bacterium]|nr:GNAT family N-acetyltransferase [Gammaproteobacteria bacterium]